MAKNTIISVDLGGTKILSALLKENGKILKRAKTPTDISGGPEPIVKVISESITTLLEKIKLREKDIHAVCLGVPGTVDPYTGEIGNAPNLKISNFNIKKALQAETKIPVYIENDVNLAALGIKRFEFKDKAKNMLVVFIGTGIGGAMIFDGKLYRGSSFYAGEIGHMMIDKNGNIAGSATGEKFETIASRTGITRAIMEDIEKENESIVSALVEADGKIKSKSLLKAVNQNDEIVVNRITEACEIIGRVLGSITTLLNIDTIVLGGGVIEAMDEFMLPKIKSAFQDAVLKEPGEKVKIAETKLGDDAALLGGIALAEEFGK